MWKHSLTILYCLIFFKFIDCCHCDTNQTSVSVEKRQLEFEEHSTTDLVENMSETSTPIQTDPVTVYETTTDVDNTGTDASENNIENKENYTENVENNADISESSMEATENSIDLNESSTSVRETISDLVIKKNRRKEKHTQKHLVKKCRHYKKENAFELVKMADVWQIVYYRLPNKLKCFKLHIKLVKFKDQQRYAAIYGNFNNTVRWDQCFLEIQSSDKSGGSTRRHFLQGTQNDQGVMENIILDEEHCQNTTHLTLHRESGDQWLVIKNLLVMRDCDTGDLVVFSRVPLQPHRGDILDALMIFGENKPNGTMACQDKTERTWKKYEESSNTHPDDI